MRRARVTMLGAFPPPVGGASLVNAAVLAELVEAGADVTSIDVSGPALAHTRSFAYHARRSVRNLRALLRARRLASPDAAFYIVPDAGLGAWYTRAHVAAVARLYGSVTLHHHSCRYIEEHDRAMAAIVSTAGADATHVFLTENMAAGFGRRYGDVTSRVAANAHFVAGEAAHPVTPRPTGPIRLGHLSNLCYDKGFFAVADAFDAVRAAGVDATLTLAGPILEQAVAERLADLQATHGASVDHEGALEGEAKLGFYRNIDLFLFPTNFKQEAAPLVVYEALAAGCPVLATDRGVISDVIPEDGGAVCARDAEFGDFVLGYVRTHAWGGTDRDDRAVVIKDRLLRDCAEATAGYSALTAHLTEPPCRPTTGT